MPLFEMLLTHAGVFCAEQAYHHVSGRIRETDFLRYDPRYLIDCYKEDNSTVAQNLPYIEQGRLLRGNWVEFQEAVNSLRVEKIEKHFTLAKGPPSELSDFQAQALAQFRREGKVDRDDSMLRLESYDSDHSLFRVQRCAYTDGLRSNFAMDLKGHLKWGTSDVTLRDIIQGQYGKKLPPLSDKRFSNSVGIAAVVFYKTENGEILPYLPKRARPGLLSGTIGTTKKQAVFSGGYHCTASGAAKWRDRGTSFHEVFVEGMCRELHEEVGLAESDLEWIYPISFCRELLRGGKPQLFFAAFTKLPPADINIRRRAAIERQIMQGRQEIEDEVLVANDPEQLYSQLWSNGTIEAVTNMALAQDFAILADKAKKFR